jgi:hypothetical protein
MIIDFAHQWQLAEQIKPQLQADDMHTATYHWLLAQTEDIMRQSLLRRVEMFLLNKPGLNETIADNVRMSIAYPGYWALYLMQIQQLAYADRDVQEKFAWIEQGMRYFMSVCDIKHILTAAIEAVDCATHYEVLGVDASEHRILAAITEGLLLRVKTPKDMISLFAPLDWPTDIDNSRYLKATAAFLSANPAVARYATFVRGKRLDNMLKAYDITIFAPYLSEAKITHKLEGDLGL